MLWPGVVVGELQREAVAAAVAAHPGEDSETAIRGSVRDWRACFPRARAANVEKTFDARRGKPLGTQTLFTWRGCARST
jgi:hypothetical protein